MQICSSSFHNRCKRPLTSAFLGSWTRRFFGCIVRSLQCICRYRQHTGLQSNRLVMMHCAPTTGGFLSGCHRPSIMARRSSPLLLALGDGSPDSVNSPMILASSALACWSWKTMLSTNHSGHHRDLHLVTVNLVSLVKPVFDYWHFILKPVIWISKI